MSQVGFLGLKMQKSQVGFENVGFRVQEEFKWSFVYQNYYSQQRCSVLYAPSNTITMFLYYKETEEID